MNIKGWGDWHYVVKGLPGSLFDGKGKFDKPSPLPEVLARANRVEAEEIARELSSVTGRPFTVLRAVAVAEPPAQAKLWKLDGSDG